jgi:hypothetical protein
MHHQKYFLVDVLDVGWAHPHAVKCPPHVLSVTLVNLCDR